MSDLQFGTCSHDFELLETQYWSEHLSYQTRWTRVDLYYCRKCLEQRETRREECSRDIPIWWKSNSIRSGR